MYANISLDEICITDRIDFKKIIGIFMLPCVSDFILKTAAGICLVEPLMTDNNHRRNK